MTAAGEKSSRLLDHSVNTVGVGPQVGTGTENIYESEKRGWFEFV